MFNSIVEAVLYHANIQPNKLCLVDDDNQITYKVYADKIRKYASVFSRLGVKFNDKVVVESCQTIDYLAIELALQLLGVIFVPVEHNCASCKIYSIMEQVKAKILITCTKDKNSNERIFTYVELQKLYEKASVYIIDRFPCKEHICEILFSTGTTGKEKGIMISHKNNIALAENVIYGVEMKKDNVEMIPSPLNHSHGLRRYYANMYNGSTVVLLGSIINRKKFFENIDKYGVNSLDLVPSALTVLLRLTKEKLAEYQDKIRYIQFGAAPMSETDKNKICQLLPYTRLYNFYGSTESGCICIYDFNVKDSKRNCIGKPAFNAKISIVNDEHCKIVSSKDNTGIIASQGEMNMVGYWQDKIETNKVLKENIIYSSDVAYFDKEGDVILLGRKGDIINVGGFKVSPEEIEDIVKTIEGIEDCGVISVEDLGKGNVPKLFVQMKEGYEFNSMDIRSFLITKLEVYKIPVFIEQIKKIPRSYNGKLLRKELRER